MSIKLNVENYFENKIIDYGTDNINNLIHLYQSINNKRLKIIFSKIHYEINRLFAFLNNKIYNRHFNAIESRELIKWIEQINELYSNLMSTEFQFEINIYYDELLKKCNTFLSPSGGSLIPNDMNKIEIIYIEPIFKIGENIAVRRNNVTSTFQLKCIGEGSYAHVFKYHDSYYKKLFAIKRAKKDLTDKELLRFKLEFDELIKLKSPYIVEVFCFDDTDNSYTMEYMDETLMDFIQKNNTKLNKS